MKLFELLLNESPLPDDWDKDIINNSPIKKVLEYLSEKSKSLGQGYFRVAYVYKDTVIKFAKKEAYSIMANKAEIVVLRSKEIQDTGLVIPLIDYDKVKYRWVQTALAEPISKKEYNDICISYNFIANLFYYTENDSTEELELLTHDLLATKTLSSGERQEVESLDKKLRLVKVGKYELDEVKEELDNLIDEILKKHYTFLYKLKQSIPLLKSHFVEMDFHEHNIGKYNGNYVIFDISSMQGATNSRDLYLMAGAMNEYFN